MFLSFLSELFRDHRFTANLIAVAVVTAALLSLAALLRLVVAHGSNRLRRWTSLAKLEALGKEATRHGHTVLFWLTVASVALTAVVGVLYHCLDGDVRRDVGAWYRRRTPDDVLHAGLACGAVLVVVMFAWAVLRLLRRLLPAAEAYVVAWAGRNHNEATLRRWFKLFENYAFAAVRLATVWAVGRIVGLGRLADVTVGFVLCVLSILAVARLLTLACRGLSHLAADYGNRHLARTSFRRYWERITRMFPFGERCFDAAVYLSAASLCVRELAFIAVVADFGPRIVECIGIFFCSRVIIELLHVLLQEAFGMYAEDGGLDQKGRTLVPLLHSICQYAIYFGSVVLMLGQLGVDTRPLLAGAGILGLAVGLGAQSLVTDVVSGFFILFENQFLVGDYVKIGDAAGTVEEVGMRVTKIRDGQGKLHIIPNGQIKGVVSYSAGYVNAVVDYPLPSGSDLESVFRSMREAGERLRLEREEVLAETEIHGIVDLKSSEMTVRAVTRVKPGAHGIIQNEYRRLLKQVLDEERAAQAPRLAA
ncbi:MAG TPA: mechanosensitive ion channel family protein [Gemmataceae bacterium]|nr:mechanosensitive ion channel family protein [Gemmataceae bacterium]